jgi:hypothetical protein
LLLLSVVSGTCRSIVSLSIGSYPFIKFSSVNLTLDRLDAPDQPFSTSPKSSTRSCLSIDDVDHTITMDSVGFSPRFSADTLFALVMLVAWTCLQDTPFKQKHPLFARFFKNKADLESIATEVGLSFAPGLFAVLQASVPPTIDFFRRLPTYQKGCWGIYAIVLEKRDCRPRLYIGSATSVGTPSTNGLQSRLKQYDDGFNVPYYVKAALDDGFTITHKVSSAGLFDRRALSSQSAAYSFSVSKPRSRSCFGL